MKRTLYVLAAAVALAALVACNPTDAKDLTQDAGKLAESAGRAAANAGVAAKVNTHLGLRKDIDMTGLHIEAEGGTVTVGGHVHSTADKTKVLQIAKLTRGVEKVIDDLRVEPQK